MTDHKTGSTLSRRDMAGLAAVAVLAAAPAHASQLHMQTALAHCQAALRELKAANDNKGGHRATAIEHLEYVIDQIGRGIAFAD